MTATSIHQFAALEWLWRWENLVIDDRGRFNGRWDSEKSRLDMQRTVAVLGGAGPEISERRDGYLTGEATPKVTQASVSALLRRGWLEEDAESTARYGGREPRYRISEAGLQSYLRHRSSFRGQRIRLCSDRISRPRAVGAVEVRRRGGIERARRSLAHHREMEAHHKRIADHLEESIWVVEQDQRDWATAKGRPKARS